MSFSKLSRIQELDIKKEPKKMLDQLAKLGRLYEYCNAIKVTFYLVKDYPTKKEFFENRIYMAKMRVDDYARVLGKVFSAISGNEIQNTIQPFLCLDFITKWTSKRPKRLWER